MTLIAQTDKINFERFDVSCGLSSSNITGILQDKQGFLWIATVNGLNRYDGYHFNSYKNNPDDSTSLSHDGINIIYLDTDNQLWIGTSKGDIDRYIREKDCFERYRKYYNRRDSPGSQIWDIDSDADGNLIITSSGRMVKLDVQLKIFTSIFNSEGEDNPIQKGGPKQLVFDKSGKGWTGTWGGGLITTNLKPPFNFDVYKMPRIPDNFINTISYGKNGTVYVGTWNAGMLLFIDEKVDYLHYAHNPDNPFSLSSNAVNSIVEGRGNKLWIGTEGGGLDLMIRDKDTPEFYHVRNKRDDNTSLSNNWVRSIYEDKSGIIWVGTRNGLNKYSPTRQKITTFENIEDDISSLSMNDVVCGYEDSRGNIWFGTWGGGLELFNPEDQSFRHFRYMPGNPSSIADNYIRTITEDDKGNLWIGTRNGGICVFSISSMKCIKTIGFEGYGRVNEEKAKHVTHIFFDNKGYVWAGTSSNGIMIYHTETGEISNYSNSDKAGVEITGIKKASNNEIWISSSDNGIARVTMDVPNEPVFRQYKIEENMSTTAIQVLHIDNRDNVWTGGASGYVNRIKPNDREAVSYPFYAYCFYQDSEEYLWIGSKTGLKKYDYSRDTFITYNERSGLCNEEIYSILTDKQGDIWLGTNRGVSRFNPGNEAIDNYDKKDGLSSIELTNGRAISTSKGLLFYMVTNGLNMIEPETIKQNNYLPDLVFTGFFMRNKEITPGMRVNNSVILDKSITETGKIILDYRNNSFSIEFAALDFTLPEKNAYKYRLYDFEEEWTETREHIVTYTNLNPGTYELQVQCSNNDGKWNNAVFSMIIKIKSPFWYTWWFYCLVGIFIVALVSMLISARTRRIKRKNKELQQMVKERTVEILEQKEELRVQNEQIEGQKEELVKLNATKDRLFSIIAHDLKNPFNAISGFASLLINNFDSYPDKQKLELIRLIHASSNNAFDMLQNLLHWSRANLNAIKYQPQDIELDGIVHENINFLKVIAENKKIQLQMEEKQLKAYADKEMVNTVIRNLMANALKFTRPKGKVWTEFEERDEYVCIHVNDNGIGMSEDVIGKLFKVDEHHSTDGTEGEQGTGIGLLLCHEFIERNQGNLKVKSIPGKGSRFTVELPRKRAGA
jgi:signal transduction histidine kinase/ligand-binding sensor domain-containing protein